MRSHCSKCSSSKRQGSDRDFIAFTRNHGQRAAAGVAQPKVVKVLGVAVFVSLHYKQSSVTKAPECSRTRGICAFLYHKNSPIEGMGAAALSISWQKQPSKECNSRDGLMQAHFIERFCAPAFLYLFQNSQWVSFGDHSGDSVYVETLGLAFARTQ